MNRMTRPPDFDPLKSETFDSAHADYAQLRQRCPVAHTDAYGGFWALTRHDDVVRALQKIAPIHREVLVLVSLEDMSYRDVAEILGVPIGTVMSRLSRGRERLRALMEGRAEPVRLKVVK